MKKRVRILIEDIVISYDTLHIIIQSHLLMIKLTILSNQQKYIQLFIKVNALLGILLFPNIYMPVMLWIFHSYYNSLEFYHLLL
jgi:hypothetical protein